MRRAIVPFALILALITGVVLDATRLVVVFPTVTDNGQNQANVGTSVVHQFYDAINTSVETGDVSALEPLLAADFVDHAAHPGMTPDRAGLLTTVRTLHEIAPTLRLVPKSVVAGHDRVAVQVGMEGADAAVFLGIPITMDRFWGPTDVFRVVPGQLVERWGDTARTVGLDPLLNCVVSLTEPTRKAVTLERWTFAPGLRENWVNDHGTSVLLVDAGSLTLAHRRDAREERWFDGTGGDQPSPTPRTAVHLLTGDSVVVAQSDDVLLHNGGTVPTIVLIVSVAVLSPTTVDDVTPMGITHTMLAGGPTTDLSASQHRIAIGRVTLPPGSMLPFHTVDVAEAVTVEFGSLAVTAEGSVWVTSVPNTMAHRADGQPVPRDGGAIITAGSVVSYGVAGNTPLTLLVVTVDVVQGAENAAA